MSKVNTREIEEFLLRKLPGLRISGCTLNGKGHPVFDAVYNGTAFTLGIAATRLDSAYKRENIVAKAKKILRMKGVAI